MTDSVDRKITAAAIRALGEVQDDAARGISAAVLAVQGVGDNMSSTHGLICAVTNNAVKAAEAERIKAGTATAGVCTELAGKLRHAADRYDETDESEKGNIDRQVPSR